MACLRSARWRRTTGRRASACSRTSETPIHPRGLVSRPLGCFISLPREPTPPVGYCAAARAPERAASSWRGTLRWGNPDAGSLRGGGRPAGGRGTPLRRRVWRRRRGSGGGQLPHLGMGTALTRALSHGERERPRSFSVWEKVRMRVPPRVRQQLCHACIGGGRTLGHGDSKRLGTFVAKPAAGEIG